MTESTLDDLARRYRETYDRLSPESPLRLVAWKKALDTSWADTILEQRDAAIEERDLLRETVRTLSVLHDVMRVELCTRCRAGLCSAHRLSEGTVRAVARDFVSMRLVVESAREWRKRVSGSVLALHEASLANAVDALSLTTRELVEEAKEIFRGTVGE